MDSPSQAVGILDVCDACRHLDYDEAIKAPKQYVGTTVEPRDYMGAFIATLGPRPSEFGSCDVCRLLWRYAFRPGGKDAPEPPPDTIWELRAYPVDFIAFYFPHRDWGMGHDRGVCLVPVPENSVVRARDISVPPDGVLACTRSLHVDDPDTRTLRLIPRSYSAERVKGWLALCEEGHGEHCSRGVPLEGFRLIDCATLTVVDATDATPWVALSYVWRIAQGTHVNPATYADDVPESRRLPPLVPGVIMDAIEVAKSLGYGYLWADRYCIDQSDRPHVERQVGLMDRIFRGADLTIVAASGRNGLPGVGSTPRRPQTVLELHNGVTLFSMPDMRADQLLSEWSSRGWTYQEQILSRRRLTFTDHEMAYECAGVLACWETVTDPLSESVRNSLERNQTFPVHEEPLRWTLYAYHYFASEFSRRTLTLERDALDAFRGIVNTFIPGRSFEWLANPNKLPLYPFHGLPSLTPEKRGFSDAERKLLTFGLSWYHHSTKRNRYGVRRPGFPSWSWMGWKGRFVIRDEHSLFNVYSTVEELVESVEHDPQAAGPQEFRLRTPAIRMRAVVIPETLLTPTFFGETWDADLKFLNLTHLYEGGEIDPVPESPQELVALVHTGDRVCVLLGGEKHWAEKHQTESEGDVMTWASFSLSILVLEPVRDVQDGSKALPVLQRVGMLLFAQDIPKEGAELEAIEASAGLDLTKFSTQEILMV